MNILHNLVWYSHISCLWIFICCHMCTKMKGHEKSFFKMIFLKNADKKAAEKFTQPLSIYWPKAAVSKSSFNGLSPSDSNVSFHL